MFNNFAAYNINNQYGNQIADQNIKPNKNIRRLLKVQGRLKTEVQTLKKEVDRLKRDNDRLRRNNDILTVENDQLKQSAFSFMQQNQNQLNFYNGQNQSLNLNSFGSLYQVTPISVNNQFRQQKYPLSLNSSVFMPKTYNQYNQPQNVNKHIKISTPKLNDKNKSNYRVLNRLNNLGHDKSVKNINTLQKTTNGINSYFQSSIIANLKQRTDNYGLHFGKKIKSLLNIESLRTKLEKVKDIIPKNPRSLSEKLKDIKASSSQKINKVPNMTSEQEKF